MEFTSLQLLNADLSERYTFYLNKSDAEENRRQTRSSHSYYSCPTHGGIEYKGEVAECYICRPTPPRGDCYKCGSCGLHLSSSDINDCNNCGSNPNKKPPVRYGCLDGGGSGSGDGSGDGSGGGSRKPPTCDPDIPDYTRMRHDECHLYYICLGGIAYELSCPEGLKWNDMQLCCDYPHVAKCKYAGDIE